MTIGTILGCAVITGVACVILYAVFDDWKAIVGSIFAAVIIFGIGFWYQNNTASGLALICTSGWRKFCEVFSEENDDGTTIT